MERAAKYERVSSPGQREEGTSLQSQDDRNREYVDSRGYRLVLSEQDVYSGFDLDGRRGLSRIREAIREGKIDVLVVYAIDRLSRNLDHQGLLFHEAERYGVRIESVTEDLNGPAGVIIRAVAGALAQMEREKIRERTMRGKAKRLAQGRLPTWTFPLYGYQWDKERAARVVREDEAWVVRYIFQSVVDGVSLHEICRQLNARGVPSPGVTRMRYRDGRTPLWHAQSLKQLLANPAFKGVSVANRLTNVEHRDPETRRVTNRARQITRPESEWTILPAELTPAIVDEATWELANERLRVNLGVYGKSKRRPYLLRGAMRCLVCGGAMYSEQEGGKNQRRVYRCANGKRAACATKTRVVADDVERWAWEQVLFILRNRDEVVAELRRRYAARRDFGLDAERDLRQSRIAELEGQQSRLLRGYAEGGSVPWSLVEREVARIDAEKAEQQERLADVEAKIAGRESQAVQVDAVIQLIDRLNEGDPEGATFEERMRLIRDLGVGVGVARRLWKLLWLVPIQGGREDRGSRLVLDLDGAEEPADPAERKRIEDEVWLEGVAPGAFGAASSPSSSVPAPRRSPTSSRTRSSTATRRRTPRRSTASPRRSRPPRPSPPAPTAASSPST